jgi:hypothetical protein
MKFLPMGAKGKNVVVQPAPSVVRARAAPASTACAASAGGGTSSGSRPAWGACHPCRPRGSAIFRCRLDGRHRIKIILPNFF